MIHLANIFCSGGLWVLPLILLIPTILLLISGYKSSKSGSTVGTGIGQARRHDKDINVSIFKTWQFKFAVILFISAVGSLIWIASDYKGVTC